MDTFPTTILLATDASPDARLATRAAVDLARRAHAALHVVHAWDNFTASGALVPVAYPVLLGDGARELLEEEVAAIRAEGVEVAGALLAQGPPAEVIIDAAAQVKAGLILLGSRGLGSVRRVVMGSVSEGVTHHAPVPVLVMRGDAAVWPPRHIVVGDDGSEDALHALQLAAGIAGMFGARITLVRALAHLERALEQGAGSLDKLLVDDVLEFAQAGLDEHLHGLSFDVAARTIARVSVEDPAHALLHTAAQDDGQAMLAVGCRGLGALQRIRFGSVSTKVLRGAHGPVLIIPHATAEQPATTTPQLHVVAR